MRFIVTRATGIHSQLSKISFEIYIFNSGYLYPNTLYLHEQGREGSWLSFEDKRGPRENS